MSNMSAMEARILDAMQKYDGGTWTIDQIASIAYGDKKRPKNWRTSVVTIMRGLVKTTKTRLVRVKRVSSIGRGNQAEYALDNSQKSAFLCSRNRS